MRPHDLLRIVNSESFKLAGPLPEWARFALRNTTFVVVRRALRSSEQIPVGLRGRNREERLAGFVMENSVLETISPEDITSISLRNHGQRVNQFKALAAVFEVAELLRPLGLVWGPTGSVGFELATGVPVVHSGSDLDLVIRAPDKLSLQFTSEIDKLLKQVSVQIDAQLETPHGAVSLQEYAAGCKPVLMKADGGPFLTCNPWQYDEEGCG